MGSLAERKINKCFFECTDCGKQYRDVDFMYLCPLCSEKNKPDVPPAGVLKTVYDYAGILPGLEGLEKFKALKQDHFLDLLPVRKTESFGYLRVGNTPLYKISEIERNKPAFTLWVKDDSQNPTFSFKDRASVLVSAYAREHVISVIVAASTGNAGSSLAGVCASQGQRAVIVVPESIPRAKLLQMLMYGAIPVLVKGNYDMAFEISLQLTRKYGWLNRNTAFNPFTIEGKKTVSFEIFEQTSGQLPDMIFVPVGDGVILSGVYKGFEDLLMLGIIHQIPRIIAVQSESSDNLVRNFGKEEFIIKPATTIADSISVDVPRCFNMAVKYLKKYQGSGITVSDHEIISASKILAGSSGIFAEPAASAAMAGFIKYWNTGMIPANSSVLVLSTGSGLKDLNAPLSTLTMPDSMEPDAELVGNYLESRHLL